ncbi:hypothetical protein INR49_024096 [Caranx melampygus]|nr:hypothetical protein INR49_024096 [Caranx melampygus]
MSSGCLFANSSGEVMLSPEAPPCTAAALQESTPDPKETAVERLVTCDALCSPELILCPLENPSRVVLPELVAFEVVALEHHDSYLVASHAVAVKNADLLILLAGHVVQALVGLHIAGFVA